MANETAICDETAAIRELEPGELDAVVGGCPRITVTPGPTVLEAVVGAVVVAIGSVLDAIF
jgi:hypothetical protein